MDLLAGSSAAAPSAAAGGSEAAPIKILCQYPGCTADLTTLKRFNLRCKICDEHCKAVSVQLEGKDQRFCQQCNKFHPLEEFDKDKRGCRDKLEKHNRRRRLHRRKIVSATGAGGAEEQTSGGGRKATKKAKIDMAAGAAPFPVPSTTVTPAGITPENFATVENYLAQLMQHQPPMPTTPIAPATATAQAFSLPFAAAPSATTEAPAAGAAPAAPAGQTMQDYMKMAAYAIFMAGAGSAAGAGAGQAAPATATQPAAPFSAANP